MTDSTDSVKVPFIVVQLSIHRFTVLHNLKNIPILLIKIVKTYTYEPLTDQTVQEAVNNWLDEIPVNGSKHDVLMKYGHLSY